MNNDGVKQSREKWFSLTTDGAAASVSLYIDLNGNGVFESGEPSQTLTKEGTYTLEVDRAGPVAVRMSYVIDTSKQKAAIYGAPKIVVFADEDSSITNTNLPLRKGIVVNGTLFTDSNANGKKDGQEVSRGRANVYYDADNSGSLNNNEVFAPILGSTPTSTDTKYQITVPEGTGVLRVYRYETDVINIEPFNITAVVGTNQTKDFTIVPEMVLQGRLFTDEDGNGKRGKGEPYAKSGAIRAWFDFNNNGVWDSTTEPSSATDANGNFRIVNRNTTALYGANIKFRLSPTKTIASTSTLTRLVFKSFQETQTYNFGFKPAFVKVHVIKDMDSSKTFTNGDSALQGAVVYIDKNRNGVLNSGEISGTTDANGFVTFSNVLPTEDAKDFTIRVRYSTSKNTATTPDPILVNVIPLEQANVVFGLKPR